LNLNLSVPADKAEVVKGYETYLPPATQPLTACPSDYLKADVLPYIPVAESAEINHDASGFVNTSYLNTVIDSGFYTKLQSEYGAIKGFTPPS
jgi:hypothetical protein